MNLPLTDSERNDATGLQCVAENEARTQLTCGLISERQRVPVLHKLRLARRYESLKLLISALQCGIAAAMIAVEVGVHQEIQLSPMQCGFDQRQRLIRVCAVTTVDQYRLFAACEKNVVG